MNVVTMDDVNYLAQQSSGRINMILSGMTELMNDTDGKVEMMGSQGWFQRMVKTVTGKNKLTKSEIQQNHDKLNAYMSEAIVELYNRNCIDHQVMISLGTQLNELYADHLQLKQMLGAFVGKLNEKIDSVDNFHMLTTEINQGIYSNYPPLVAMCKVISQFDKRILEDNRKLDILKRSLIEQNILNNEEILLTEYLKSIIDVPVEDIGQIHLEISTIRNNFMASIILQMIEKYHFLPDMARKMKNKKSLIDELIKEESLDDSVALSINEIYDDFIKSKIDANYRLIPVQYTQEEALTNSEDSSINSEEVSADLESEDVENILNTAYRYYYGDGVAKDYLKALEYFEKAYDYGSGDAANMIGTMHKEGHGVSVNNENEFIWMKRAAELGSVSGQVNLANCYHEGRGTNQDYSLARQWYTTAADSGNDYAATEAGKIAMEICYYVEAVKLFRQAAENGYADAQNRLGARYFNGQGVKKDKDEAMVWFTKAAEQGHIKAQCNVGECYYYGDGVSKDTAKSKEWLRKSADQGYEEAIKHLSEWFGEGQEESSRIEITSEILKLIEEACDSLIDNQGKSFIARYKLIDFFDISYEDVYLGYDSTILNSGKNGFAITEKGIYCREMHSPYTNYVSFELLANSKKIYRRESTIYADGEAIAYIAGLDEYKAAVKKLFQQICRIIKQNQ